MITINIHSKYKLNYGHITNIGHLYERITWNVPKNTMHIKTYRNDHDHVVQNTKANERKPVEKED